MAYYDVSLMVADYDLNRRIIACAAQELSGVEPVQWVADHAYVICSQPGWAEAWSSAIASSVPNPGRDEGVITDGMILSATQAVIGGA
jgi:hypothetical protein